jgi:hypothetical protein
MAGGGAALATKRGTARIQERDARGATNRAFQWQIDPPLLTAGSVAV